jgi:tetratricopeptide (TPR) repeat protein
LLALVTLSGRVYDAVRSPPQPAGGNPNARLFSVSGAARADYWRVAWHDVEAHPLLGSGAGTYELRWYRERPNTYGARDAHQLYLEALAEVGPLGLVLLLVALASPLVAARRPRSGLVAAAVAAYCAYLAHAGVDWDWEVPTVTLTALACACVVLAGTRPERPPVPLSTITRGVALAAAAVVIAIAALGYLGSTALEQSALALRAGDFPTARAQARRAARLEPWSPIPWRALGDAEGQAGNKHAALADYRRMLAKDPNDWFAWYAVAVASDGTARAEAARAGLRLNPRSPELAALLGPS